jgi:hypothetical protein
VLNLMSNQFSNIYFSDVIGHIVGEESNLPIDLFVTRNRVQEQYARDKGLAAAASWVLTFDNLFKQTDFIKHMRAMLSIVKAAYQSHVDIEFTTNFLARDSYKINLLQCRPYQVQTSGAMDVPWPVISRENVIMEAHGAVIGHTRMIPIDRLIYVVPAVYGRLAEQDRYAVARLIGKLTHLDEKPAGPIMLIGPGRWGTSTPSLGIPVSFSEIHMASVLCEIDAMHEGLVPDLSLGTHFLNEVVEMNMLYIACFTGKKDNRFNEALIMQASNRLAELLPQEAAWSNTVRLIDVAGDKNRKKIYLAANALEQMAMIYLAE